MISFDAARAIQGELLDAPDGWMSRPSMIRNVVNADEFYVQHNCNGLHESELKLFSEIAAKHGTHFKVHVDTRMGDAQGLVVIFGRG